jgi:hypothetical protein
MAFQTLSEIANRAADELLIARPSAYVGGATPDGRLFLACANGAGRDLMRAHQWGALQSLGTITTVVSTSTYALADDYDRMIQDTGWDRTEGWMMVGPDSPQINRYLNESGVAQAGVRKRFRLQGTNVIIWPTPTAVETLVYEYVSNKWARAAVSSTPLVEFAADTDTTVFDPDLMRAEIKWRFLKSSGMAFEDMLGEAMVMREGRIAADLGGTTLTMSPEPGNQFIDLDNIPDSNWAL